MSKKFSPAANRLILAQSRASHPQNAGEILTAASIELESSIARREAANLPISEEDRTTLAIFETLTRYLSWGVFDHTYPTDLLIDCAECEARKPKLIALARARLSIKEKSMRGAAKYIPEILAEKPLFSTFTGAELEKALLNGADNWHQASAGGCYLISSLEIADRLMTRKAYAHYVKHPEREDVIQLQFIALTYAAGAIYGAWRELMGKDQ